MYSKRPVFLGLLVAIWIMILGFNNCSPVGFQLTEEGKQGLINLLSTESTVMINNGAPYTNQQLVQLSLFSARAIEMKISNEQDCSDGTWEPFSAGKPWTLIRDNTEVSVYVEFKNLAGGVSKCISAGIVHDNVAPIPKFANAAGLITKSADLSLHFSATDAVSGVDHISCVDANGVAFTDCGSSNDVHLANEGTKTFVITATDRAGNVSNSVAYSWMYDKTPPTIAINSKPPTVTGSSSAAIAFAATDALSGIDSLMCRIDSQPYQPCASPQDFSGLAAGPHTFDVYAKDKAGNNSTPANASWSIDNTAPTIQFTQTPPANSNSASGNFAFTGSKNGTPITQFECHLDSAAFASCASPQTASGLSEGTHKYTIRGIDGLGNKSAPLDYTWLVDATGPSVTVTSGPGALGNSTQATFQWTATDAGSGVKTTECQLDSGGFQPCSGGSNTYPNVGAGPHAFVVRATDNAGNSSTASRDFNVDLTAPVVTMTSAPDAYVNATAAQKFTFTATDANGISGYECKVDIGNYAACTSPYTATNIGEGGHVFYVRATDKAGNVSQPATASWNLDLAPPIVRVISAPTLLKDGDHAVIQYEVVDLASGVDIVKCGPTFPSGSVATCQAAATVDLGAKSVGSYVFDIQATDKVGNSITEHVAFEATTQAVVCDPFSTSGANCSGGLVGNIYYLDSAHQNTFAGMNGKTVDYFYSSGIKVNALLNLNQLFVSTRSFSTGFPTEGGALVKDNTGQDLYSYFAFDLKTVLKLDSLSDQPGWYQFATLSDDGSVVVMTPQGGAAASTLISSDGDHATKMGCGTQAVYFDDTTRLGLQIKYYQGPPTEIALVFMWKRVSGPTAALDSICGHVGNDQFFGSGYNNFTNKYDYGKLVDKGWRVIAPANYVAPAN